MAGSDQGWVPYSQRTPEGKAAWDAAIAEMEHVGEIADEEARREEAEYFAKREEASEAEWDRRLAFRVAELEAINDGLSEPWLRVAEHVRMALARQDPVDDRIRHWGVWHPEKEWWFKTGGEVFATQHKALAEAQCEMTNRFGNRHPDELYEVRCIEDWADERQ